MLADRVAVMKEGQVQKVGAPTEIFDRGEHIHGGFRRFTCDEPNATLPRSRWPGGFGDGAFLACPHDVARP